LFSMNEYDICNKSLLIPCPILPCVVRGLQN
jgi:hypothetical protein